jgi:2-(1,2-epoxy-1,2-dihydrophenyl)acetyl-CoA isomerase
MSETQYVLYETKNRVATITLNRPEQLNALTDEMLGGLSQALKNANKDNEVRTILLTGAGRGFCAGQDISNLSGEMGHNRIYEHILEHYQPVVRLLRTIEKPILAAINGVAAGAGASLALACDLRIMAKETYLTEAFSNIGFIPDAGSTWFLVRQLGFSRAFELAIEAERIPAERCLELGLANRVVEGEQLMAEAYRWAERLAQRPALAVGLTKRAMNRAMTSSLWEAVEYEAHMQQLAAESEDFVEGVKAFREKRPAVFKGKS